MSPILAIALTLSSTVYAISGSNITHIPKSERFKHDMSEYDWEKYAGGEESSSKGFSVIVPKPPKFTCSFPISLLNTQVNKLARCAGLKEAVWELGEMKSKKAITIESDTAYGLIQSFINENSIQGHALIYINKIVLFKEF
jgi:hypothetical protein